MTDVTDFLDLDPAREPFRVGDPVRLAPGTVAHFDGRFGDCTGTATAVRWQGAGYGWTVTVDWAPNPGGGPPGKTFWARALTPAAPTFDTEIAALFLGGT